MTVLIYDVSGNITKLTNVKVSLLTSSGVLVVTDKSEDKKDRRSRNYILQNLIYYETIPDEAEVSEAEQREIEELKLKLNDAEKQDNIRKKVQAYIECDTLHPADPLPNLFPTFCKEDCCIPPCERSRCK